MGLQAALPGSRIPFTACALTQEANWTYQESRKYRSGSGQSANSKGLRPLPPTPRKQIAFEFKFTVKLRLEFDFDFDFDFGLEL